MFQSADINRNYQIDLSEVSGLASLWRRGEFEEIDAVTGAARIWRNGESYRYNSANSGQLQFVSIEGPAGLVPSAEAVSFPRIISGASISDLIVLSNNGVRPVRLLGVSVGGPFAVEMVTGTLDLDAQAMLIVTFNAPDSIGDFESTIEILTDQTENPVVRIPVKGEASNIREVPLEPTVGLRITSDGVRWAGEGIEANFTVEIPPSGPTRLEAEMVLSASPVPPPGVTVEFSESRLRLGRRHLVEMRVLLPELANGFQFHVLGQVMVQGEQAFVVSAPVGPIGFEGLPGASCNCAPGTPVPTRNLLESESAGYPDPVPNLGRGVLPDVGMITATIEGPRIGECCKNGAFHFVLTVDSDVNGANNAVTGNFLDQARQGQNGLGLRATTNGRPSPINNGPNHLPPRHELQTSHEVPINCGGVLCPCAADRQQHITVFALTGVGAAGEVEVHWTVDVGGSNCVLNGVTATVDRIVFLRNEPQLGSVVYAPDQDKYVPREGDDDGDGIKNYKEVVDGTRTAP